MTETDRIANLLRNTYESDAWHGPSVKEVLASVDVAGSDKRVNSSHSIAELVNHMTAWRNFVINKLTGNDAFDVTEDQNFPKSSDWRKSLYELHESQQKLISAIQEFPPQKLSDKVPGRSYDYYTLVHGIIQHDIYHIGQIQIIKKAL